MSGHAETVEQLVRSQLSKALGGGRGVVESAIPTIAFTICWIATNDLRTSLYVSIGLTLVLLLVRLVQRTTIQFVMTALFGIGIAALFAARSGEARDVFLPGILYNGGYAVVLVISIVVGWPVVGFIIGSITGEPTEWHDDRGIVRLCSTLTWLLAAPCVLRVLVQYPLWASDQVALLGTSKVVLGWPLQVASFAAMAWVLSRNKTPLADDEPQGSSQP
ncbi:DUF3159 domain-containing protein [Aeromicrobium sp. CF4.19]|uniref:DUF3159 domain-containing protein n=1 Tax=Aeromicrobium sp. CF4.19 TaxID=3373082 RepID=UPI003EE6FDA9